MKKILSTSLLFLMIYTAHAVPFKLVNTSLKSIYLEIPGVMNPNLSPMSVSGVGLDIGQKIYFYSRGKRYVLITVNESLRDQKVNVKKLIEEKQKMLRKSK